MRALRSALAAAWPAGLAGGCAALGVALADQTPGGGLAALLAGGLLGALVLGLVRLFPVARWAFPVVGLLVGPLVPLALFVGRGAAGADDRGGLWVAGAVFGALIGLIEWARLAALEGRSNPGRDLPGEER